MSDKKYYTIKDDERKGWCIFIQDDLMSSRFVSGAFESKEKADSECFRLNEKKHKG